MPSAISDLAIGSLNLNKTQESSPADRLSTSIIIPAFNEEASIARQIEDICIVLNRYEVTFEIIVIDDASDDRTVAEALSVGARILQHQYNRGYGAALKTGIMAAKHDAIIIIDADGTYPADQIPQLLTKLEGADMVVGARIGDEVNIPWKRRPAKGFLRWLASYISEQNIPDLNSGLRAFRRDCAQQYFSILPNRFSFTTTITMALLADDYLVVYHPINYYPRTGKSKIQPRHFMDFVVLVLRMSMMFQPLKVFVPLSFACGGLGLLKAIYDTVTLFMRAPTFSWSLLYQPALSTSAVLLLLVGLQFLLIGMVADGVVRRLAQHYRPLVTSQSVLQDQDFISIDSQSQNSDRTSQSE
jgi:hypothetical protein